MSAIGGNTTVAVSMAAAKAAAMSYNLPLYNFLGGNFIKEIPYPLGNMMNGGAHAGPNAPDIQEFLVVPVGANDITEAVFANVEVHKRFSLVEKVMKEDGFQTSLMTKLWRFKLKLVKRLVMNLVLS